jgi:hypothetical protein
MSLYRPEAGELSAKDEGEVLNIMMNVVSSKHLECDGLPVWYVGHTGSLRASLRRITKYHEQPIK